MISVTVKDSSMDTGVATLSFPQSNSCSVEQGGALVIYEEKEATLGGRKDLFVVAGFNSGVWVEFWVGSTGGD